MKHLEFQYDIQLNLDRPVEDHQFVLRCIPPSFPGQNVLSAQLQLDPPVPWNLQEDGFGNLIQSGALIEPHSRFHYSISGEAEIDILKREKEEANPVYRFASGYTAVSKEMAAFLAALCLPRDEARRAELLLQAVHEKILYTPGTTGVHTTAAQAFAEGRGVCQDYAHIYLALARESGLTARYCNGIHDGGPASHAWCEVHLGGMWVGIDPTAGKRTDDSYLRFNVGRDFADCPLEKGVFRGITNQTQTINVFCGQKTEGLKNDQ